MRSRLTTCPRLFHYALQWPRRHSFLFCRSLHIKQNLLQCCASQNVFLKYTTRNLINNKPWNSFTATRISSVLCHLNSSRTICNLTYRTFSSEIGKLHARNTHNGCQRSYGGSPIPPSPNQEKANDTYHAQSNVKKPESGSGKREKDSYLFSQIPKMPHRPTKEELLSAATGFWSRLKVRFKWFSIRSVRPWNIDDWSAFVSWFVLGNIVWVLVGTTTFFSLVIISINTVFAQETLARWIGDYLTHSSGIKVVFESAVVPKWKDGVITFHNVFISRRPGQGKTKVRKGSVNAAAVAAAAERQIDTEGRKEEEDTNYTQFDLTIAAINVSLSFVKWWNGKGILRDVEVKGVRGVVDRTSVSWKGQNVDPRTYLHQRNPGDFEIDSFRMDDLLVTIYQPNGFRPFSLSIFSCDLPKLRKQWLFYDFLSADHMSGAYDGSLFTIHPNQIHSVSRAHEDEIWGVDKSLWKKHSRLRIDGLKIDHLNRGVVGPFGWIHEGNVDIVADILFPCENVESIAKVMSDFYDRMEATVTAHRHLHEDENKPSITDTSSSYQETNNNEMLKVEEDRRFLIMELKLHLNEVKATVPLFSSEMSYVNQALIRPIVAYINNKRTFIPINCRIVKDVSDFDGSWTIFDSCLMDNISAETYEAFAKDVVNRQARIRRLKKVGMWSISLAIQALFMGMAGNVA
ncbi:Mitochondrial distribution and morphology protein 31 [Golovinomyces cichoracearum]|uniref:Mitochondrial distribution and morphology protein 31 n=1 Tax=Golovinomyces cichoracearum TaxID=62708 RepID=A0A420HNS0_9PEZI|nr:Mitochondrial distribution and morphology protein 31 [Golovinomyces cichoracearum]